MRLLFAANLLLVACGQSHSPSCVSTTYTIADDVPLPDLELTVADLTAGLAGERVVPAQLFGPNREVVGVTAVSVQAARGEGDATWTESELVDTVTTHLGPWDTFPDYYVRCADWLSVPATLDVAREDADGALVSDGHLTASPEELAAGHVEIAGEEVSGEGVWADITSAYAGYTEGRLVGVQLTGHGDILLDWR